MITRLILLFLFSIPLIGRGQNKRTASNDTVIYYKQDQPVYYFDLKGKNQKLFFDSVIYDNKRPITVFIKNNTPNLIEIYPRYHANTFWKHGNKRYIEPNAYFKAELIIAEGEKFKRIGHLTGYLKIEYWDGPKSARKQFELVLKGKVGLGMLPPFKNNALNEKTIPNENPALNVSSDSKGVTIPKQKNSARSDTIIVLKVDNRIYTDTLPFPIPGKYDTLPYREDKIWIDGNFYTKNGSVGTTRVNRNFFVDGTVLEYYQDGKLYSKRTRVDSSDLQPYFISYYQDGKLWTKQFISQTIEYAENGRKRSVIKDDVKTTFFDNGKMASIEYLGRKRNTSSPFLTEFYLKTGCKAKEIYRDNGSIEGQTVVRYRENICDCPKSKVNNVTEIYYKKCDLTVDTIITRNYPGLKTGKFDSLLNLVTGTEEIGRNMIKNRTYSFRKSDYQYLSPFTFRRFTETGQLKYRDSIFVIEFNGVKNNKKNGVWLNSNLSTAEFVNKLINFEKTRPGKSEMAYREFVFLYPWNIYKEGDLTETQYYSKYGDVVKSIRYQGTDTTVTHYEYKLLMGSTIVDIDSPMYIYHNNMDTVTYYDQRFLNTVLIYENNALRRKTSPHFKSEHYTTTPQVLPLSGLDGMVTTVGVHSSGFETIHLPFTVEKGEFKDLELYNGTIEYYDKDAKLVKIAAVINGKETTGNE